MRKNALVASIALVALVLALTAWLIWQASGKETGVTRPGDVPHCGLAWRSIEAAKPSPIYNELHGVVALSEENAWAIGTLGEESAALTLIEHWDGTSWKHVESPNVPGFSNHLYSIA